MRSGTPALRLFLWSRAAIWLLALATVVVFEGALNARRGEWDSARLHELGVVVDVWARWDSDWYLRIAENGYSWPSSTPAFFPLYPLLVACLGRLLLGHYVLAGVVVSLAGANAHGVIKRQHKNLAIANGTGSCRIANGLNRAFHKRFGARDLETHLLVEFQYHGVGTIALHDIALATMPAHARERHSRNSNLKQGALDISQFFRPDDITPDLIAP